MGLNCFDSSDMGLVAASRISKNGSNYLLQQLLIVSLPFDNGELCVCDQRRVPRRREFRRLGQFARERE